MIRQFTNRTPEQRSPDCHRRVGQRTSSNEHIQFINAANFNKKRMVISAPLNPARHRLELARHSRKKLWTSILIRYFVRRSRAKPFARHGRRATEINSGKRLTRLYPKPRSAISSFLRNGCVQALKPNSPILAVEVVASDGTLQRRLALTLKALTPTPSPPVWPSSSRSRPERRSIFGSRPATSRRRAGATTPSMARSVWMSYFSWPIADFHGAWNRTHVGRFGPHFRCEQGPRTPRKLRPVSNYLAQN